MVCVDRRPDHELEHSREHGRSRHRHSDDFFGLDVQKMSPKAQVTAGLAVLIPVAVAGVLVITLVPWLWWLVFVFGWTIFPAFGLLVRGIAGVSDTPADDACVVIMCVYDALQPLFCFWIIFIYQLV